MKPTIRINVHGGVVQGMSMTEDLTKALPNDFAIMVCDYDVDITEGDPRIQADEDGNPCHVGVYGKEDVDVCAAVDVAFKLINKS